MERRDFIKFCAASAVAAPAVAADARARFYSRARLVDANGIALKAKAIPANRNLIFHYPYASTPCFLLNLGRPAKASAALETADKHPYEWRGGVGAGRSVVAYSAICPHTYTHPTIESTMIHYFGPDAPATVSQRAGVVTCCVHGSTFEPGRGAVPLQPPAEIPLATVVLEWEEATDALFATGLLG